MLCIVCEVTSGAHKCKNCKLYAHMIYGTSGDEYGPEVLCQICEKAINAQNSRSKSLESLKIQGEKTLNRSNILLPLIEIGKNVTVSIPNVDRGRIDLRNIMAVVLERFDNNYKLGTTNGIISSLFPNSFATCLILTQVRFGQIR